MRALVRRLVTEDDAQDLVEYALLTAFIGLASVAAIDALRNSLQSAYLRWNAGSQACWQMPRPNSGGGC